MAVIRNKFKLFRTNSKANILDGQSTVIRNNELNRFLEENSATDISSTVSYEFNEINHSRLEDDNDGRPIERHKEGFIIPTIKMAAKHLEGLLYSAASKESLKSRHLVREMRNTQTSLQKLIKSFSILSKPLEQKPLNLLEKTWNITKRRTKKTEGRLLKMQAVTSNLDFYITEKNRRRSYMLMKRKNIMSVIYMVKNISKYSREVIRKQADKRCDKKECEFYKIKIKSLLKSFNPLSVGFTNYGFVQRRCYSKDDEKFIEFSVQNCETEPPKDGSVNRNIDAVIEPEEHTNKPTSLPRTEEFSVDIKSQDHTNYSGIYPTTNSVQENLEGLPKKPLSEQLISDIVKTSNHLIKNEDFTLMKKSQLLPTTFNYSIKNNTPLIKPNSAGSLTTKFSRSNSVKTFTPDDNDTSSTQELINAAVNRNKSKNISNIYISSDTNYTQGVALFNRQECDARLLDRHKVSKENPNDAADHSAQLYEKVKSWDMTCSNKHFLRNPTDDVTKLEDMVDSSKRPVETEKNIKMKSEGSPGVSDRYETSDKIRTNNQFMNNPKDRVIQLEDIMDLPKQKEYSLDTEKNIKTERSPRLNDRYETSDNTRANNQYMNHPKHKVIKLEDIMDLRKQKECPMDTEKNVRQGRERSPELITKRTTNSTKGEFFNVNDKTPLNYVVDNSNKNTCDEEEYLSYLKNNDNKFCQFIDGVFRQDLHHNKYLQDLSKHVTTKEKNVLKNAKDLKGRSEFDNDSQKTGYSVSDRNVEGNIYSTLDVIKVNKEQLDVHRDRGDINESGDHASKDDDSSLTKRIIENKVSWNDLLRQEMLYRKILNYGNNLNSVYRLENDQTVKYEERNVNVLQDMMQYITEKKEKVEKKLEPFNKMNRQNKVAFKKEMEVELVKQKINRIQNPITMEDERLERTVDEKNSINVHEQEILMTNLGDEQSLPQSHVAYGGNKVKDPFNTLAAGQNLSDKFPINLNYPEQYRNEQVSKAGSFIKENNNANHKLNTTNSENDKPETLQNKEFTDTVSPKGYSPKKIIKEKPNNIYNRPCDMQNVKKSKIIETDMPAYTTSPKTEPSRTPRKDNAPEKKANIEYNDENITVKILHNESTVIEKVFAVPPEKNEITDGQKKERIKKPAKTAAPGHSYVEFKEERIRTPIDEPQSNGSSIIMIKPPDNMSLKKQNFVQKPVFPSAPATKRTVDDFKIRPTTEQNVNKSNMLMNNSINKPNNAVINTEQSQHPVRNQTISNKYNDSCNQRVTNLSKIEFNGTTYSLIETQYNFKSNPFRLGKHENPLQVRAEDKNIINGSNSPKSNEYNINTMLNKSSERPYNTRDNNRIENRLIPSKSRKTVISESISRDSDLSSERKTLFKLFGSSSQMEDNSESSFLSKNSELYLNTPPYRCNVSYNLNNRNFTVTPTPVRHYNHYAKRNNLVEPGERKLLVPVVGQDMSSGQFKHDTESAYKLITVGGRIVSIKEAPFENKTTFEMKTPSTKEHLNNTPTKLKVSDREQIRFFSFYKQFKAGVNDQTSENYKRDMPSKIMGRLQKRVEDHRTRMSNTKYGATETDKDEKHYDYSIKIRGNNDKIMESMNRLEIKRREFRGAAPFRTRLDDGNETRKNLFGQFYNRVKETSKRIYGDEKDITDQKRLASKSNRYRNENDKRVY